MCATFLKATGQNVGETYVEEEFLDEAKELLNNGKIVLPIDVVTENGIKDIEDIKDEHILDIGPRTLKLFETAINKDITVLMNGSMGKYEEKAYEEGTKGLFEFLSKNKIKTVICGGDTAAAAKKFKYKPYYLSTGGGASLEYLEGKEMPALSIMEE